MHTREKRNKKTRNLVFRFFRSFFTNGPFSPNGLSAPVVRAPGRAAPGAKSGGLSNLGQRGEGFWLASL